MRIVCIVVWLAALLPVGAAGLWASFAGRWPEPWQERMALREVTPRWALAEWSDFVGEPAHFVTRVLHLGALQVPGATVASVTWVNVLLAVSLAVSIVELLRRCFSLQGFSAPVTLAITGLLVASPAYGANWLHAERLGVFLPPLLLLWALSWLHGDGGPTWRAIGALCLVTLAPFCHTHGILLTFALLPALAALARRKGSTRMPAWLGACLIVGNVAAVFSMRSGGGFAAEHAGFGAMVLAWLERTGDAWLDLMPSSTYDEWLLGGLSWLLPVFVWRAGDRSVEARSRAAPWWSCFCFGLLVVACDGLRYGVDPPPGTWREAMYGAFLLPVGAIGVLAARFGNAVLVFAGGALAVLAVQDWQRGIEDLRLARMDVLAVEARMALPAALQPDGAPPLPVRIADDVERLRQRGLVPLPDDAISATIAAAAAGESSRYGTVTGGDVHHVAGSVRSSLRYDTVQALLVVASTAEQEPRIVGAGRIEFGRTGRNVAWQVRLGEQLGEGDRVRVLGYLPRERQLVALGSPFVAHGGALQPEPDRP